MVFLYYESRGPIGLLCSVIKSTIFFNKAILKGRNTFLLKQEKTFCAYRHARRSFLVL